MADTKISALPAGAALGGTEAFVAVQTGADVQTTPADVLTYVQGNIATGTPSSSNFLRGDFTWNAPGASVGDPGGLMVMWASCH
jgi:hypothetical protein